MLCIAVLSSIGRSGCFSKQSGQTKSLSYHHCCRDQYLVETPPPKPAYSVPLTCVAVTAVTCQSNERRPVLLFCFADAENETAKKKCFWFLLLTQEEKLRVSILDYLQRYHPDDTETCTMVSLYFSMNRQIANMLENTAQKHLHALKGKSMGQ